MNYRFKILFILFILNTKFLIVNSVYAEDAEYWSRMGSYAVVGKDWNKAIECFTKAIELNPSAEIHNNRGTAFYKKGIYDKAINDYNKSIEINPKIAEAYYGRGTIYAKRELHNEAIADFNRAIKINPKLEEAYLNRGTVYAKKGLNNEAIEDWTKAIYLNPIDAEAYYNRGRTYTVKGLYSNAITDLNSAIELNPEHADAYLIRGSVYDTQKLSKNACDDFYQAGLLFLERGDRAKAIKIIDGIKMVDSSSPLIEKLSKKIYGWSIIDVIDFIIQCVLVFAEFFIRNFIIYMVLCFFLWFIINLFLRKEKRISLKRYYKIACIISLVGACYGLLKYLLK